MRAGQLTKAINDERGGKADILVSEEGTEEDKFWEILGGKGTTVSFSSLLLTWTVFMMTKKLTNFIPIDKQDLLRLLIV